VLQQELAAVCGRRRGLAGHLTAAAVNRHVQLALNEGMVGAAVGQQLGVSTGLDDVALPHDHNDVGVANRRQTMRHDQNRAALHSLLERALHRSLTLSI
jgi:hypothetical protein